MNPLISVIVPIYNAEAYLERCVDSVLGQSYARLEVILVDDGSTDRCGEMCDAFARKDSRVRVFHKENGGLSSARNWGLDHATGEYIGFVDADDWIGQGMYAHLYGLIQTHDVKIACCGIYRDFPDGKLRYFNPAYPADREVRVYEKIDALREIMKNARITYSVCDKLFHRDIFSGIRMTVGMINEDTEIQPQCIETAERIVYDPTPFYHYTMTPESITRGTFSLRRFAEVDVTRAKAMDYQVRYPQLYPAAMAEYYTICLLKIRQSRGTPDCKQRRNALIAELRQPLVPGAFELLSKNEKIKLTALRISPVLFDLIWNIHDLMKK